MTAFDGDRDMDIPNADDVERAAECRKEGRRIYNRERGRRSLVECENEAIAAALATARAQGIAQARAEMREEAVR